MITKQPIMFKTTDGLVFVDELEARKHEALIEAKDEYETARKRYAGFLFESQKTADNQAFQFGIFHTYWYIAEIFYFPSLISVQFHIRNCELDDNDHVVILRHETDNARGFVRYRISDLYMHKENAEIALLAAQQERLSELTDVVAKLEESIQNDEDDD